MSLHFSILRRAWLALWLVLLPVLSVQAQTTPTWTSIGPGGGSVKALVVDPLSTSVLYAGTDANGVLVSIDAGAHWRAANVGLVGGGAQHVHALATFGSSVYAALDSGVYVSPAGGTPSWVALPLPGNRLPQCNSGGVISDGVYKYLARVGSSLYLASDCEPLVHATSVAGSRPTWSSSSIGAGHLVQSLGELRGDVAVGSDSGLFLPDRSGATLAWRDSEQGVAAVLAGSITAMASSTVHGAFVCASAQVYQASWPSGTDPMIWNGPLNFVTDSATNCNALTLVNLGSTSQHALLMSSHEGAFVSSVLDDTSPVVPGALPNLRPGPTLPMATAVNGALQIFPDSSSPVWWFSEFGIYRSLAADLALPVAPAPEAVNGPVTLGSPSGRLDNVNVVDLIDIGSNLYLVALSGGDASYADVMRSSDQGATWSRTGLTTTFPTLASITALAADSTRKVLYAGTDQGVYAYRESDPNWVSIGSPSYVVKALAVGAQALYTGRRVDVDQAAGLLALPLLDGTSFAAVDALPGLPTGFNVRSLTLADGTLYVGGNAPTDASGAAYFGVVYAGTDLTAGAALPVFKTFGAGAFSASPLQAVSRLVVASGRVYAAGDGFARQCAGPTSAWSDVPGLPLDAGSPAAVTALALDSSNLYLGFQGLGVYAWTLGSSGNMVSIQGSLPSTLVNSLRVIGGALHVATSAGVARPALPESSSVGSGGSSGTGGTGISGGAVNPVTWNGGGGCSIASLSEPDPLLWLMVMLALAQLSHSWLRSRRRHVKIAASPSHGVAE